MTNGALYKNYEYGILIHEDEKETIERVYSDFVDMINSELSGIFTTSKINRIAKYVKLFKRKHMLIKIDESEDQLIPIDKSINIKKQFTEWEKDIFDCIDTLPFSEFKLTDVYKFEKHLKSKHPKNNFVKEKIRQILQALRDLGFVKFVKPGEYKKLWLGIKELETNSNNTARA